MREIFPDRELVAERIRLVPYLSDVADGGWRRQLSRALGIPRIDRSGSGTLQASDAGRADRTEGA